MISLEKVDSIANSCFFRENVNMLSGNPVKNIEFDSKKELESVCFYLNQYKVLILMFLDISYILTNIWILAPFLWLTFSQT